MILLHVTAADGSELVMIPVEVDEVVTLGRDDRSRIQLAGPEVSRTHARLTSRGTFCEFEDPGSKAGVFLVDARGISRRLPSGKLGVGQKLRIGTWVIHVTIGELPLQVVG